MADIVSLDIARRRKMAGILLEKELALGRPRSKGLSDRTRVSPCSEPDGSKREFPLFAILLILTALGFYTFCFMHSSGHIQYSARANLLPSLNIGDQ